MKLDREAASIVPRTETTRKAVLVLEDGAVFRGKGLAAFGQALGKVSFNTSMTGYQEILTDPSYAGQIITFTFPHISNVVTNDEDVESRPPTCRGLVLREDINPSRQLAGAELSGQLANGPQSHRDRRGIEQSLRPRSMLRWKRSSAPGRRTSPCNAQWSRSPRRQSVSVADGPSSSAIRSSATHATRGPPRWV